MDLNLDTAKPSLNRFAIVVSGLPASGKTTIGRRLAAAMSLPFLDKDVYLEALFVDQGMGDHTWRRRLSLEADARFQAEAQKYEQAVLVSHWRGAGMTGSGTPTEWIHAQCQRVIEVYCDCPPELAAERFLARTRHNGHLDQDRSAPDVVDWMRGLVPAYPLKIGPIVPVPGTDPIDVEDLADRVRHHLA